MKATGKVYITSSNTEETSQFKQLWDEPKTYGLAFVNYEGNYIPYYRVDKDKIEEEIETPLTSKDSEARRLYPEKESVWFCISNYQPILDSFGEILVQVDDDDYQGDSRILYKKDNQYGYLIFGWGSCSGCDALQACSNYAEVDKLIESLRNDIKWFNSLQELKDYFGSKDWELEYSWQSEETKEFINKVKGYMEDLTKEYADTVIPNQVVSDYLELNEANMSYDERIALLENKIDNLKREKEFQEELESRRALNRIKEALINLVGSTIKEVEIETGSNSGGSSIEGVIIRFDNSELYFSEVSDNFFIKATVNGVVTCTS